MAIKHDVVARYRKNALTMALSLVLAGCSSLFDSPPDKVSVHEEVALKRMEQAASFTPESAVEKAADKSKSTAQQGSANAMKKNPGDPESEDEPGEDGPVEWVVPQLSFERFRSDMPQLAVWGLEEATFLLDGKQIELGQMTRVGRIALVAPGHHRLQVKCPSDPPFSADFYLVKDDRAVLRGRCSSGKRTVPGGGKRN